MTTVYDLFSKAGEKKTKQLKRKLMGFFGSEATISHDGLVKALEDLEIVETQNQGRLATIALNHKWIPLSKGFLGNNYLYFEPLPSMAGYKVSVQSDFLYDGEA